MVTDPERREAVLETPYILILNQKIRAVGELWTLLEQVMETGTPLLLIAEDVEDKPLQMLTDTKLHGSLACAAVKAPGFGDRRRARLQDIAILTDGELITDETELGSVQTAQLGRARRVIVTKDTTTIVDGMGDGDVIKARIEQIETEIENTDSDYDREKLQERLDKIVGGVAVIKVSAAAEADMQDRVEGAVRAATAAVAEGYVAGGGVALVDAGAAIDLAAFENEDERAGAEIVLAALEAPLRQIAESAGVPGDEVLAALREAGPGHVFDAISGRVIASDDDAAPIDPAPMPSLALAQAAALTERVLTTQGVLQAPRSAPAPPPATAEVGDLSSTDPG
jgi:chaperonin GroEL